MTLRSALCPTPLELTIARRHITNVAIAGAKGMATQSGMMFRCFGLLRKSHITAIVADATWPGLGFRSYGTVQGVDLSITLVWGM